MPLKFAGLAEIRKELQLLPPRRLQEVCLRLASYKKDNKELLAFLLFESDDKSVFLSELKSDFRDELVQLQAQSNLYYVKKSLRRLVRSMNRYIKFMDDKALSLDLLLWFCSEIKEQEVPVHKSAQLRNLYEGLQKKMLMLLKGLHEDLRQDYETEIQALSLS